jgi:hypothetical protein
MDMLDVLKLLLIFVINTWALYVFITPYIIFHVPHDSLQKRISDFHELGRYRI